MISWRARRQLSAILIVAVLAAVILTLNARKIIPAASCADNKQNQRETGIDCGGPCRSCELKHPLALSVFWTKAVQVRPGSYDTVAYVRNPNKNLSSGKLEYEFTLFDSLGEIARRIDSTFILPQESTYIIEPSIQTTREPSRVEFRVVNTDWEVLENNRPSVIVEKRNYGVSEKNGKKQSIIEATVFNRSPLNLREVETIFLVLDKAGNILGVNKSVVGNLYSGERRDIRLTWPDEITGEVSEIQASARVNIFDPTVILKH